MLNYISDDRTVKYAIATNGDIWQMQIRGERKLAVDLILTERQDYESALELLKISRSVMQPAAKLPEPEPIPNATSEPESETHIWLIFDEL